MLRHAVAKLAAERAPHRAPPPLGEVDRGGRRAEDEHARVAARRPQRARVVAAAGLGVPAGRAVVVRCDVQAVGAGHHVRLGQRRRAVRRTRRLYRVHIEFVCDYLPPLEIPLLPSKLDPVVIFTDAEGKKRDSQGAPTGHLGFVVYHPVFGRRYASAKAPDDWVRLFDSIKELPPQ